jgi:hypothetical protein
MLYDNSGSFPLDVHEFGIVKLASVEQEEDQAEYAITQPRPHPAIGSPPRLERCAASSVR